MNPTEKRKILDTLEHSLWSFLGELKGWNVQPRLEAPGLSSLVDDSLSAIIKIDETRLLVRRQELRSKLDDHDRARRVAKADPTVRMTFTEDDPPF